MLNTVGGTVMDWRKPGFEKNRGFNHMNRKNQKKNQRNKCTWFTERPYTIRENNNFVKYYQALKVCKDEEFEEFMRSLKTELPVTFRIAASKEIAKKLLDILQDELIKNCLDQTNPEELPNIFPLPWYPNNWAWQMELTRKDIGKSAAYQKLQSFLTWETKSGTISCQETVSIIPPLVLDVQPHHKVLDMFAEYGIKTTQLVELLHATDDPIPSGYVIASNVDDKQCNLLSSLVKGLKSPCVAIINHDGAQLPSMLETASDGFTGQVQFDRILCDVPCSADGTVRTNPYIWSKWSVADGLNFHTRLSRILRRGVELLAVGGKIVYSTSSINPIENEAVIHAVMSETNDALELVDVASSLPELKYSPGMEEWLVSSPNLEFYKSFDDVDDKWVVTIKPQMFPPKPENRKKFSLNRCIRILPHHQNTGTLFVAVLRKIKHVALSEESAKLAEDRNVEIGEGSKTPANDDSLCKNKGKKRKTEACKEFVFFKEDDPVWNDIKTSYEISEEFDSRGLWTTSDVGLKSNIFFTSNAVRDLVVSNQGCIKFVTTGVKAFVRCDSNMKCAFRITNSGLKTIYPYIGEVRKIHISKEDFIMLLLNNNPEHFTHMDNLSKSGLAQIEKLSPGCCVLVYTEVFESIDTPLIIHTGGWRGFTTVRCYKDRQGTAHLLRVLGHQPVW